MIKNKKYRPYLTLSELKTISAALRISAASNLGLIRYIDVFISQCDAGLREPNYTTNPTPGILEKLGFSPTSNSQSGSLAIPPGIRPISELMQTFKIASANLTFAELQAVQEYRYANSLMSPEEEVEYEITTLGISENETNSTKSTTMDSKPILPTNPSK
jgi:hypothetical protein